VSEKLDLVSLCCRAETDVDSKGYLCLSCNMPCEAIRPDRTPKPFDPDRAQWVRKPDNSPRGKE